MDLPRRTCKQRHQDRHRAFIGQKIQNGLDKILNMRFDPLFHTELTTSDLDNYKAIDEEWERYELYLQSKAVLTASIEGFALIEHKIVDVKQGEEIPPTNMIFDSIPTAENMHPSYVGFEHSHNGGLRNRVYSYPDQRSIDDRTACEPSSVPLISEEITTTLEAHPHGLEHADNSKSGLPAMSLEHRQIPASVFKIVGDIMIHHGFLTCVLAATLSAALEIPLLQPICKRKRQRNTRVIVKTLVDDRLPLEIIDLENAKLPRPTYQIGSYYNSCSAVNGVTTLEWDILRYCPCAVLNFKDLCEAFRNQTFSRWFYLYYLMLRTSLKRHA